LRKSKETWVKNCTPQHALGLGGKEKKMSRNQNSHELREEERPGKRRQRCFSKEGAQHEKKRKDYVGGKK